MTAAIVAAADDPQSLHETVRVAAYSIGFAIGQIAPNAGKVNSTLLQILAQEIEAGYRDAIAKPASGGPPRISEEAAA